jgi:NAD(P)-dependent dehydrogenase (short-subunit alcohol dehydrogenase family)
MPRAAIVTGGAGALGQAVTLRLLADGGAVAVPWVVDKEREALTSRVPAAARDRLFEERCDVIDAAALAAHVERVRTKYGRVDALVSLVGGFAGGTLLETDRAAWDRMLALNLTSAYTAARAVLPGMRAAGAGRVVLVASRAALAPSGGFIAYTVAKAAIVTLVQALSQEVREFGITVNAVAPSTMDTPGNRAAMPDSDRKGWVPVESVAAAIAWLAAEESAHVTGTVVAV